MTSTEAVNVRRGALGCCTVCLLCIMLKCDTAVLALLKSIVSHCGPHPCLDGFGQTSELKSCLTFQPTFNWRHSQHLQSLVIYITTFLQRGSGFHNCQIYTTSQNSLQLSTVQIDTDIKYKTEIYVIMQQRKTHLITLNKFLIKCDYFEEFKHKICELFPTFFFCFHVCSYIVLMPLFKKKNCSVNS